MCRHGHSVTWHSVFFVFPLNWLQPHIAQCILIAMLQNVCIFFYDFFFKSIKKNIVFKVGAGMNFTINFCKKKYHYFFQLTTGVLV